MTIGYVVNMGTAFTYRGRSESQSRVSLGFHCVKFRQTEVELLFTMLFAKIQIINVKHTFMFNNNNLSMVTK